MQTIKINGKEYPLKFGMNFLKEINKQVKIPVQNMPGVMKEIGFASAYESLLLGDIFALRDMILLANKTEDEKITEKELNEFLESEECNLEALIEQVKDFLSKANATKIVATRMNRELDRLTKK